MRKILFADDSPLARDVVSRRLLASGIEALACASSADARVKDPSELACALLDIDLGDGDGTEVAEGFRAACPGLPIAFFTAGSSEAIAARARALGPVFAKPDEIDSAIAWVCHHAR